MRRPRKLPPVRTWLEPIDGEHIAALASCRETRRQRYYDPKIFQTLTRRVLYGRDTWVIVPREPRDGWATWRERAHKEARIALVMLCVRGAGSLEFIGICDDEEPA